MLICWTYFTTYINVEIIKDLWQYIFSYLPRQSSAHHTFLCFLLLKLVLWIVLSKPMEWQLSRLKSSFLCENSVMWKIINIQLSHSPSSHSMRYNETPEFYSVLTDSFKFLIKYFASFLTCFTKLPDIPCLLLYNAFKYFNNKVIYTLLCRRTSYYCYFPQISYCRKV